MTVVTPAEFKSRRQKLLDFLGPKNIAIIHGAKEIIRNGDVHYPFRQNSDFYYLTGFSEPDAIAVFTAGEYILFNRPRNPEREIWDGKREGQEGVIKNYGVNTAYSIELFESKIKEISAHKTIINPSELEKFLSDMRLIKSPAEIKTMRIANNISIDAHIKTLQYCQPNLYEYELQAVFTAETLGKGSFSMAYPPIIAAGKNSCTLHYMENNQKIHKDNIVLIDAGCEFENYASDITRTFPANGKYNSQQKDIYTIVYEAQRAAINLIKPGITRTDLQNSIVQIITQGLIDLKLLKGNLDTLIEQKAYLPYYMHSSGHWLGLDTHDTGGYTDPAGGPRKFEPGMVLTVEPGLYISEWDTGVRIEDNILVTKTGHENLTEKLPRELSAIENLMKS